VSFKVILTIACDTEAGAINIGSQLAEAAARLDEPDMQIQVTEWRGDKLERVIPTTVKLRAYK
jgi:hypothetical protein